ncbi:M1 family metallopeptidase [Flavicella sp.]|uniref:M1 family metallopeptidase n=1 Tax=Flavicella sp. TaxID=2957742 RepID=UPI003015CFF5
MRILIYLVMFLCTFTLNSQKKTFTKKDSLRGNISPDRSWWDLQKYELDISVDILSKSISGSNKIFYKVLENKTTMQIDLQKPMNILEVKQGNHILITKRIGDTYTIYLKKDQIIDSINHISIKFEGIPLATNSAPWRGGFTWTKDEYGCDFIGTSCQGDGASLWWPCKDHPYDKPDKGIELFYTVPQNLVAVGNGRLIQTSIDTIKKTKTYHWKVINPINNYAVQMSIGNYINYRNNYKGESGIINCDYYILKQNFSKAKSQFMQVDKMLEAFEFWFGPYPFYEDSYKIVEAPYLGMEHQSAISYGNNYKNGYRGTDLSGTGWGLKFDFIIIHESGHEWFGNNITNKDIADMWIHESFTNYSEAMYLEYFYGKKAANEYLIGIRKNILNDKPIIGNYNVNNRGSEDMYYKGANMLQNIRYTIANDETWRLLLRGLNQVFYHQTVTTKEIENYISDFTGIDFSKVFDQYLRTTQIPTLEYKIHKKNIKYRWTNCIENFDMPLYCYLNKRQIKITPNTKWQRLKINYKIDKFTIDKNYYINLKVD